MHSLVLGYDSALSIWSSANAQMPVSTLSKTEIKKALGYVSGSLMRETLGLIHGLPWSSRIPRELHVLIPDSKSFRILESLTCHRQSASLPKGSLVPLGSPIQVWGEPLQLYATSPELTFVHMARHMSFAELVELGYELCGEYAVAPLSKHGFIKRSPVTSANRLIRFTTQAHDIYGIKRARCAAQWVLDGSRSPKETNIAELAFLPRRYKGFGMMHAELNPEIKVASNLAHVIGAERCFPDICWNKAKLIIEYDSRDWHTQDERMEHDARKRSLYHMLGYECITMTAGQLYDFASFSSIIMNADERVRKAHGIRKRPFPAGSLLKEQEALHHFLLYGERYPRFTDPAYIENQSS